MDVVASDLSDVGTLKATVHDVEYVFHIAGVTKATRRRDYFQGNVETTRHLLQAAVTASSLKRFCFVSSLTAVGPSPDGTPLTEDAPCRPITSYGQSKLEAEQACLSFRDKIPLVILRPPAVYGPRDKDILEIFRSVKRGINPMFGGRKKSLSLIHVSDLARAIVDATLSDATIGNTYFVTDPIPHDISELVRTLSSIMKKRAFAISIPAFLLYGIAATVEGASRLLSRPAVLSIDKARDLLQPHWICSGGKLEVDIGFRCAIPIDEGLRTTYQWYRQQDWL